MNPVLQLFESARVNGISQGLQDPRLLPQPMIWNQRIPDVKADESEILARFNGTTMVADIIADDAKAGVYNMGAFSFYSAKIPNLKIGIGMNQAMINVLGRLQQNYTSATDMGIFSQWQNNAIQNGIYAVQLRKELLKIAMLTDALTYDRLGIKILNGSWGMPASMKITVGTDWSSTSATPISDLRNAVRQASITRGKKLRRATMTTVAFQYAIATTEFQNQVKAFGYGFGGIPIPAIPMQSDATLISLMQRVLGAGDPTSSLTIEIDDRHFETTDSTGLTTVQAMQPVNKVILTDPADDGNSNIWDFAQGIVTESVISNMMATNFIGRMPVGYGPMAYATVADANANPPGIVHWAVDRGFPRRHQLQASACLTVGNFSDNVSTTLPYP